MVSPIALGDARQKCRHSVSGIDVPGGSDHPEVFGDPSHPGILGG